MKTIEGYIDAPGYGRMVGQIPETTEEFMEGKLIGSATIGNCQAFAEVRVMGWVHPHTFVTVMAWRQCCPPKFFNFQLRKEEDLRWSLDDNGVVNVWSVSPGQDDEGGSVLYWRSDINGFRFNIA